MKARYESVPKKTRDDSAYCVRLWEDWVSNRQKVASLEVPPLSQLDKQGLKYWLSRSVMEVRAKKGEKYASNSLLHNFILCGIMRHLRQNCGMPDM